MQSASFEATFPIMAGLDLDSDLPRDVRHADPPRDIALGNLAWIAARLALIATIFTVVIVAFGAAESPLIVLAIPAAILTGLAFAAPIAAFSATQKTPDRFSTIFRFGITPLFLFSGTFFPISSLPAALQAFAWLTPLFHGVALTRGSVARDDRRRAGRGGHPRHLPDDLRRGRVVADDPHDRGPAGARMTALRVVRRARVRQPALASADRTQPVRLQARLDDPVLGLLRAVVLPARDRVRARARSIGTIPGPAASRSATSCSSRRRCSRARR